MSYMGGGNVQGGTVRGEMSGGEVSRGEMSYTRAEPGRQTDFGVTEAKTEHGGGLRALQNQ